MATWAVCCAGLLEHCLAFWRECLDRGPILWKTGKPAPGETPLHHSLPELLKSKLSSARELLTVITVGVESGKFNKLFGKFSIPIVFLQKITELRPQNGFFEDNKLKICNKFDLRSKIAGVIPKEEINKGK